MTDNGRLREALSEEGVTVEEAAAKLRARYGGLAWFAAARNAELADEEQRFWRGVCGQIFAELRAPVLPHSDERA